jgi:hypothetical protein
MGDEFKGGRRGGYAPRLLVVFFFPTRKGGGGIMRLCWKKEREMEEERETQWAEDNLRSRWRCASLI